MVSHNTEADGAFVFYGMDRFFEFDRIRHFDECFEVVVERFDAGVGDFRDVVLPLVIAFEVHAAKTAHGRTFRIRRENDLRAEIALANNEALCFVMFRNRTIHRIDEEQVWLPCLGAHFEKFAPHVDGAQFFGDRFIVWIDELICPVFFNRFHEFIRNNDAMVDIQALAIHVSARRLSHLKEFFDIRMINAQVCGCRAASCGIARDGNCFRVHDF